jgi:parvulin-like peptidyl-prolyl isomerase
MAAFATPAMMTRFPRPRLLLAAAFSLFAAAFAASAQDKAGADLFPDPVVATGKGFEIRHSLVEDAFITVQQQQNVVIPESDRLRVESDILLHLVVNKIVVQKATEDERTKTRDEVVKYLDQRRKAAPSEAVFQQEVSASGKTLEQIQAAFLEKELARVVLIRELVPSNAISDAALKAFYADEKNATNFAIPELVHIAHILVSVMDPATRQTLAPAQKRQKEALAQEIKAKADKDTNFAALVKLYSDDTSTKERGVYLCPPLHGA